MPLPQHSPATLPRPEQPSPLLNLAAYPPTVRSPSTWTLAPPCVSIPPEWKQKSATWREEQVQRIREEQQRYRQRWLAAAHAAWTLWMRALAPVGGTIARERPRRPVHFETPSARATLMEPNVPSARASSRTANATLGLTTGPRYFVRLKESWRQLAERIHHHKNPRSPSQHNSDNILSDLPTAIRQSTEKKGRRSPQRRKLEEDEEGDKIGEGEAHQQSLKRARRCKGK